MEPCPADAKSVENASPNGSVTASESELQQLLKLLREVVTGLAVMAEQNQQLIDILMQQGGDDDEPPSYGLDGKSIKYT